MPRFTRFFNVKNDESDDGPKIVWDEQINILQPEVAGILDKLRNGQEVVLPLKSVVQQEEKEEAKPVIVKVEEDAKETEEGCWSNVITQLFSFFAKCFSIILGAHDSSDTENTEDPIYVKSKEDAKESYSTEMPLLEEHQKELKEIWSRIETNGIITGRRTMRKLTENTSAVYNLKKVKIEENEYYILHQQYTFAAEKNTHSDLEKLKQVYETLTQSLSKTPYTGYFYQTKKCRGFTFHYTSEIDAHWNSQKFEIKAFKEHGKHFPYLYIAYRAAIQCLYSDIKECIFGFYTDTHITLKMFTYKKLIQIIKNSGWNIETAKSTFDSNANQIINFIEKNDYQLLGKIVKITKKKNNTKMDFEIQDD